MDADVLAAIDHVAAIPSLDAERIASDLQRDAVRPRDFEVEHLKLDLGDAERDPGCQYASICPRPATNGEPGASSFASGA